MRTSIFVLPKSLGVFPGEFKGLRREDFLRGFLSPGERAGVRASVKPILQVSARASTLLLALVFCVSCRSLMPLPPADLSAPGWRVQQGQALWKPTKTRPELAGELLLATNSNGDFFVQLAKAPFTLATAQMMNDRWQIEFGSGDYRRSGRGQPPARFVWFQLPTALAGAGVSGNWSFDRVTTNSWRLENHRTGEALEGGFFP